MAAKKPAKKQTFTAEERAAMNDYVREKKGGKVDGEKEVLAKIAAMPKPERAIAERLHALIKQAAPSLAPRTWYGMPAYAKDDKVVCYFKPGAKFKMRYATLGFSDKAKLDDGGMWPTEYAVTQLTGAEEAKITALVKQAITGS